MPPVSLSLRNYAPMLLTPIATSDQVYKKLQPVLDISSEPGPRSRNVEISLKARVTAANSIWNPSPILMISSFLREIL
ncbi:hypothetical protein ONZ45_g9447 [Pleurotus djamor]|nr:hypothetical protein ONZ45_g9447 [Pleurotus djamor]